MIENLHIKNVALIEEIEITFCGGLNILTGETGAGKSIVIDSINFMLGERPGKDFIRTGAELASVEGLLYIWDVKTRAVIQSMGVEIDDDNMLLIYRTVNEQGKTNCKINGKNVTIGMLREVSGLLVDIHGQHEHQSLLNPARHIELLDRFCEAEIEDLKASLSDKLKTFREIMRGIKAISGQANDRTVKMEILQFQINEIESARLKEDEETVLTERRRALNSAERITKNTIEAVSLLYGNDTDELSAIDRVARALNLITEISGLDPTQSELADRLADINANLEDVNRDLLRYADALEHDPDELDGIEMRLDVIYRLKRKYGGTVTEILKHYQTTREEYDRMVNSEEDLNRLNAEKKKCGNEIVVLCKNISAMRKTAAEKITIEIEEVLKDLGMKNARFDIVIEKKNEFGTSGYDRVEFMISPNLGESLKPLAKIASGGEMSRVMLALKTVLADADSIETFIFDEIDAGVSGRTAQQVAEKLSFISRKHQILCITHLPQIAAMGDAHFLIEKKSDNHKTVTHIYGLDNDKMIVELARLIGGVKITDATLKAAGELKQMALQVKNRV